MVPSGQRAIICLKHYKIHCEFTHRSWTPSMRHVRVREVFDVSQTSGKCLLLAMCPISVWQLWVCRIFGGKDGRMGMKSRDGDTLLSWTPPSRNTYKDIPPLQRWQVLPLQADTLPSPHALQGFIFPRAKRILNVFLCMIKNSIFCSLRMQAACKQACATGASTGQQRQRGGASNNSRAANLVPAIPNRHQKSIFFFLLWLLTSKIY